MIVISHRGNIDGPNKNLENKESSIQQVIDKGHLCEVDVWRINEYLFLSHDFPPADQHPVNFEYFQERRHNLIIHCKNIEALQFFQSRHEESFHYFWHETDDYTVTSHGWIWAYPGKNVITNLRSISVAVLPETVEPFDVNNFSAVCTDYLAKYNT